MTLMLMLVAMLGLACATAKNTVRLGPNPTADSLVFVLRSVVDSGIPPAAVYGLSVVRCDTRDPMWTIATDGSRPMVGQVVYGRPVTGFPTQFGPVRLTPGCYEVILSDAKVQRFDVTAGGAIRVRE